MSTPRVTLYSRTGCHLCDAAREVVVRVCEDLGESWVEVDIDSDGDLADRFGEEVPVTFVDGAQHDFWRVDEARLRAALGRHPGLIRPSTRTRTRVRDVASRSHAADGPSGGHVFELRTPSRGLGASRGDPPWGGSSHMC